MGAHVFPFREAEVHASADAEARPSADYLAAADLLPAFSRKHGQQADSVASLARLLLASVMADGLTGSLAAAAAVNRAADREAEQRRKAEAEMPSGDTMATAADAEADGQPLAYLPRATYPAPDRLARLTDADRLAMVTDGLLGPRPRTEDADTAERLLALLAQPCTECDGPCDRGRGHVWASGHGAEAGTVSGVVLASAMVGAPVARGRRTAAWANLAADLLASLDAGDLPAWALLPALNGADAAQHDRGTLRDTRTEASGPAGPCVRTVASGYWLTLEDRSIRLTEAEAIGALYRTDALPAATVPSARRDEEIKATLASPAPLQAMRRPAGVGVGMIYGTTGQRAGEGYAEQRLQTSSRKRKRDGGIGSAMVTGGTGYGYGPAGKAADAGKVPTAADLRAARVAAMTPAQQANLVRLERASLAAAADLKATLEADMPGKAIGQPAAVIWQYGPGWLG